MDPVCGTLSCGNCSVLYPGILKTTNTLAAAQTTNCRHTTSPSHLFAESQLNPYGRRSYGLKIDLMHLQWVMQAQGKMFKRRLLGRMDLTIYKVSAPYILHGVPAIDY